MRSKPGSYDKGRVNYVAGLYHVEQRLQDETV